MQQRNLFVPDAHGGLVPNPMASPSDPETSRIAAERMASSGKVNSHMAIILGIVKRSSSADGMTNSEIFDAGTLAEKTELVDDKGISRRLLEMIRLGMLRRDESEKRRCRVAGSLKTVVRVCK